MRHWHLKLIDFSKKEEERKLGEKKIVPLTTINYSIWTPFRSSAED